MISLIVKAGHIGRRLPTIPKANPLKRKSLISEASCDVVMGG
jgi:hypothetical protein